MTAVVVATAGHIDHGKTSLLKALTGMDADRLPEEQRRGMTLDVGYAFMTLPNGTEVDFVDVPGHQELLNNTIVGAAEADGFLLIVDAAEGIRAQTAEHLHVLSALGLDHGVGVVTKTDVVDRARADQVVAEVTAALTQTLLRPGLVVSVSARTGSGMRKLIAAVANLSNEILMDPWAAATRWTGPPLLPIDRAFVIRGRGTVVTGTLRGGELEEGQSVRLEPGGHPAEVVEVQRRGKRFPLASGSGRVALRLRGVRSQKVQRGMIVALPYAMWVTTNALVVLPAGSPRLKPTERIIVHAATDRVDGVVGRVWSAGDAQLARLRLRRPVAITLASRILLRKPTTPSAFQRLALIDAGPHSDWRGISEAGAADLVAAVDEGAIGRLKALLQVRGAVSDAEFGSLRKTLRVDFVPPERVGVAVGSLWLSPQCLLELEDVLVALAKSRGAGLATAEARQALVTRLKSRDGVTLKAATATATVLVDRTVERGVLIRRDTWLFAASQHSLADAGDQAIERLLQVLSVPDPPRLSVAVELAGCSASQLTALERQGAIVRIGAEIAYAADTYQDLVLAVRGLAGREPVTPARLRDEMRASRKYAVAMLEHLGRMGVLVRIPDGHILGPEEP